MRVKPSTKQALTQRTNILEFIDIELYSAIFLFVATITALILANSPFSSFYEKLIAYPIGFEKTVTDWTNEGLMALFFLLVGLEIKREMSSTPTKRFYLLPAAAAVGGVILPAIIYSLFVLGKPKLMSGWAIPTATDIAFSLALFSVLKNRIPDILRLFLLSLAIFDDLIAVIVVAFGYSKQLNGTYFSFSVAAFLILILLNYFKIRQLSIYLGVGLLFWLFLLNTGIHASLAGFFVALTIPLSSHLLEKRIHPIVAFFVLPIFALLNAGIIFGEVRIEDILSPITWGIFLGLFLGKQAGIMLGILMIVKSRLAALPDNVDWLDFYGTSIVCGIGFTMSLFIAHLAFGSHEGQLLLQAKIGIFSASLLSGLIGYLFLRFYRPRRIRREAIVSSHQLMRSTRASCNNPRTDSNC